MQHPERNSVEGNERPQLHMGRGVKFCYFSETRLHSRSGLPMLLLSMTHLWWKWDWWKIHQKLPLGVTGIDYYFPGEKYCFQPPSLHSSIFSPACSVSNYFGLVASTENVAYKEPVNSVSYVNIPWGLIVESVNSSFTAFLLHLQLCWELFFYHYDSLFLFFFNNKSPWAVKMFC